MSSFSNESTLQNTHSPHKNWVAEVIADSRNSQFDFHWGQFSGRSAELFTCPATDDFFRARMDHMIDLRHPLAVLVSRMPWQEIEARVAQVFSPSRKNSPA